jgi:hypothetical protein
LAAMPARPVEVTDFPGFDDVVQRLQRLLDRRALRDRPPPFGPGRIRPLSRCGAIISRLPEAAYTKRGSLLMPSKCLPPASNW